VLSLVFRRAYRKAGAPLLHIRLVEIMPHLESWIVYTIRNKKKFLVGVQ